MTETSKNEQEKLRLRRMGAPPHEFALISAHKNFSSEKADGCVVPVFVVLGFIYSLVSLRHGCIVFDIPCRNVIST